MSRGGLVSAMATAATLAACDSQRQVVPVSSSDLASRALALESGLAPTQPVLAPPPVLDPGAATQRLRAKAPELDRLGPQDAWAGEALLLGAPLDGETEPAISAGLRELVLAAVQANIPSRTARVQTAVMAEQMIQAEAAFDMLFSANGQISRQDEPSVSVVGPSGPIDFTGTGTDVSAFGTGVQQLLSTGGTWTLSTEATRTEKKPLDAFTPNPNWQTAVTLGLDQPLLRGFGSDVALAQVKLTQNASAQSQLEFRKSLLDLVKRVEETYWRLAAARQRVASAQWLLAEGGKVRDLLEKRRGIDATDADYAEAVSVVEQRAADLVRARLDANVLTDQLKLMVESPAFPVGDGCRIVPTDRPTREAVVVGLREAIVSALERNPGVLQSLLKVDAGDIQLTVAQNGTLPQLDLAAQVALQGLDGNFGDSYQEVADADFVNWLVGATLSQPIGNRAPESLYRETRLQRAQAALGYRRSVDQAVTDIRTAMRQVVAGEELVERTGTLRLAAAESMRALASYEENLAELSPEFLQLKFLRQQSMASAHMQAFNARVDMEVALASLRMSMGTGLDPYGITIESGPGPLNDVDPGLAPILTVQD
ncbi:MAG: TolC family protein [Planctomycetota bacterium]|nr:TolC family protein [Planctomycetota bacterium]